MCQLFNPTNIYEEELRKTRWGFKKWWEL